MVDQLKPKCVVKILDCCVQGQGHNEQLKIVMICTDFFFNNLAFCKQASYDDM